MQVEMVKRQIVELAEDKGKALTKLDYIALCVELADEFHIMAEAAKDDQDSDPMPEGG